MDGELVELILKAFPVTYHSSQAPYTEMRANTHHTFISMKCMSCALDLISLSLFPFNFPLFNLTYKSMGDCRPGMNITH